MVDITPIVNALIMLIAAIITTFIIPLLKKNASAQDLNEMLKWIDIAVMAAQQMYYMEDGPTRKQYVLDFLAAKGYDVDSDEVDAAIESAVLKLHQELEV